MSAETYKVLFDILQPKPTRTSDLCCLCFTPAGEDAISSNDKVTVKVSLDEGGMQVVEEERMARILVEVLGEEVTENISLLPSICRNCATSAINSYKFMKKVRRDTNELLRALENLNNCFENVAEDQKFKTLFVSVNLADMTIQQLYDMKEQTSANKMTLLRFHYIANGDIKAKDMVQPKPKDTSTIFYKTHELVADPSKPKEYKCKMCFKQFPTSGNLRHHFFAHHFKKEFQCDKCPKQFGTMGLLESHKSISHVTVECNVCGKRLLNRTSTIKRHYRSHERGLSVCDRCGRSYKKRTDYQRHLAQDSCTVPSRRPGAFICGDCGYKCSLKHQLKMHIKFEHMNAPGFICKWCSKKCYSQSALNTHVLKHTKEKNHICGDCGSRFVTKQSLLNHSRLHTGERPYPCSHCEESFLSASRRKDHIERLHSLATYDCDLCDAKYTAKRSLTKHKKRHFE